MRVLRRIVDDPRYSEDVKMTDLEVRRALNVPSLDRVLQTARLRYFARLVRNQPNALLALLFACTSDPELPWLALARADTEHVRALGLLPGFPPLYSDKEKWLDLLQSPARWSNVLDQLLFVESVLDRQAHTVPGAQAAGRGLNFQCTVCHACFPSERALASHCRAKHGHRLAIKSYIDGSGTCPCCGTRFRSRLRCIAHLSDRRRPRCADWVLANCVPLDPSTLETLAERDREML